MGAALDRIYLPSKGHDEIEVVRCGTVRSRTIALDMFIVGCLGKLS